MGKPARRDNGTLPDGRPVKITFAVMGDMGVRGVLVFCADFRCGHLVTLNADRWPDAMRLSDIEPRFTCTACGRRLAQVRPDFDWDAPPKAAMGYRNTAR
jgi:hypothetical protein